MTIDDLLKMLQPKISNRSKRQLRKNHKRAIFVSNAYRLEYNGKTVYTNNVRKAVAGFTPATLAKCNLTKIVDTVEVEFYDGLKRGKNKPSSVMEFVF